MPMLVGVTVLHIADAVDEDHQADGRHHKQRHRRERINHPADEEKRFACRQCPDEWECLEERMLCQLRAVSNRFEQHAVREDARQQNACNSGQRADAIVAIEKKHNQREREERENGNQEGVVEHRDLKGAKSAKLAKCAKPDKSAKAFGTFGIFGLFGIFVLTISSSLHLPHSPYRASDRWR